jgi:hypothetical protein
VTEALTKQYGQTFTVLNMANAYTAGGGVVNGCIAQEENMYRRTNCYEAVKNTDHVEVHSDGSLNYKNTHILKDNAVLMPKECVCFIGQDVCGYKQEADLVRESYQPMKDVDIFLFNELKSAAVDTRHYNIEDFDVRLYYEPMNSRIENQFQTLINNGKKYVVLSAFGCGAFINRDFPPTLTQLIVRMNALLYLKQICEQQQHFTVIAFSIYDGANYGNGTNSEIFNQVFSETITNVNTALQTTQGDIQKHIANVPAEDNSGSEADEM